MLENTRLANENTKLAIYKQGQVVSCLAYLLHVLQAGLNVRSTASGHCVRQVPAEPSEVSARFLSKTTLLAAISSNALVVTPPSYASPNDNSHP